MVVVRERGKECPCLDKSQVKLKVGLVLVLFCYDRKRVHVRASLEANNDSSEGANCRQSQLFTC